MNPTRTTPPCYNNTTLGIICCVRAKRWHIPHKTLGEHSKWSEQWLKMLSCQVWLGLWKGVVSSARKRNGTADETGRHTQKLWLQWWTAEISQCDLSYWFFSVTVIVKVMKTFYLQLIFGNYCNRYLILIQLLLQSKYLITEQNLAVRFCEHFIVN